MHRQRRISLSSFDLTMYFFPLPTFFLQHIDAERIGEAFTTQAEIMREFGKFIAGESTGCLHSFGSRLAHWKTFLASRIVRGMRPASTSALSASTTRSLGASIAASIAADMQQRDQAAIELDRIEAGIGDGEVEDEAPESAPAAEEVGAKPVRAATERI